MDNDVEIWLRLNLVVSRVNDTIAGSLRREHGITLTEFLALLNLAEAEEGKLRMQALSDAVGLDQSSISRLIARLAKQGWLERCVCPDDRRGIYAQITETGREKADKALPSFSAVLTRTLDEASLDLTTAGIVSRLRHKGGAPDA